MNDIKASAEVNVFKMPLNFDGNFFDSIFALISLDRYEQAKDIDISHIRKLLQSLTEFLSKNPNIGELSLGGISIKQESISPEIKKEVEHVVNNSLKRIIQEQINLEKIALYALEETKKDMRPNQHIDDDWLNLFQDNVKSVFREDAQRIWGKILAGEIKKPESFSIRTLNTLKNLSRFDVIALEKLGQYVINSNYVFSEYITQENILTEDEINSLKDNDLIRTENGKISAEETEYVFLRLAGSVLKLIPNEYANYFFASDMFIILTKTAKELLSLTEPKDIADNEYIKYICKAFDCRYEPFSKNDTITKIKYEEGMFFSR